METVLRAAVLLPGASTPGTSAVTPLYDSSLYTAHISVETPSDVSHPIRS